MLGEKEFICRRGAVAGEILDFLGAQIGQLLNHLRATAFGDPRPHHQSIILGVLAIAVHTAIERPCLGSLLGVSFFEVGNHFIHRFVETVQIQAVKPDLMLQRIDVFVVILQPTNEIQHVRIAPHPRREAVKTAECIDAVNVRRCPAHIAVDPIGIRPIRLSGHRVESFFHNEAFGDLGALAVKLVSPVGRLAKKDDARISDHFEQPVVILLRTGKRLGVLADTVQHILRRRVTHRNFGFRGFSRVNFFKQATNFLVGRLGKIVVPLANGYK